MRLLVLIALAGCGRLGFDDTVNDPPGDAASAVPNVCNPRPVGTFSVGSETPTKVRATQLSSGGFAVAVETDAANVYMARLDANGEFVSMHLPFAAGYTLHGISQIADRPFVYVYVGAGYIKMLVPDWNSYDTGPSGEQLPMDPQQAILPGGTLAMYGTLANNTLSIAAIDVAGTTSVTADYAPAAQTASFASTPSGARVVVENAGTCETFTIAPDGTTGARHMFNPCYAPLLAMRDDQFGGVLHQTAPSGPLALHVIPAIATDPGSTKQLEIGANPRIAVVDGALWVGYLRGAGEARLVRFEADGAVTSKDFLTIADAFDLLPNTAFWFDATGLNLGETCN